MGLLSSSLLSSFWGFMAIISLVLVMTQGGGGNKEPYYSHLCSNTNQTGMPNTQMNAMCPFPQRSGKLPGRYPETPWGLPSSVSPLPVPQVLAMLPPQQCHSPPPSLRLLGGKRRHTALPSVRTYSCPKLAKKPSQFVPLSSHRL